MDVDVAAQAIHPTTPVAAWLQPGQPKNAAQHPVALWVLCSQCRRVEFSGGSPPHKHCTLWLPGTNFYPDTVQPAWGAAAPLQFTRAVQGAGDGVATEQLSALK